jgi:pimeloyl-ACP methyl ester carboxylesterase
VIDAAGGAPMVGVGISRGGNLLVHLTAAAPALLSKLILVDALAEDIATGGVAEFRSKQREPAAVSGDELEKAVRRFVSTTLSEPGTEELREQRVRRVLALPKETVLSFFDWDPEMNIVPLLDRVRVPTLVMHGTADRRIPFEVGRYLAARIPGAQLYPFAGRCHLPAFTATQEFCDVLRTFVRTGRVPEAMPGVA